MKEHPIIFSTVMIQAIMAGGKTMTRRIIKPQPHFDKDSGYWYLDKKRESVMSNRPPNEWMGFNPRKYGNPGDKIWVRENFYQCIDNNDRRYYAASEKPEDTENRHYKLCPSIYMPRIASRITLEITDIKVERVQDITQDDIEREGLWFYSKEYRDEICINRDSVYALQSTRIKYFRKLWETINGSDSWIENPWVWCISFKKI